MVLPATICHNTKFTTYSICDGFLARTIKALDVSQQPIINLQTGKLFGVEAHMRGHEKLELPSMDNVVQLAKDLKVSDQFYFIGLEKALKTFSHSHASTSAKLFFKIEGSVLTSMKNLHEETLSYLEKYNVNPESFCLELSDLNENANCKEITDSITKLRSSGINFASNKFGRSSHELQHLYHNHLDYIKIDSFLIKGMAHDNKKRLFISTLVNLCHVLGIGVIMQDISSEEDFEMAWKLGGDFGQGHFISPPQRNKMIEPELAHVKLAIQSRKQKSSNLDLVLYEYIEKLSCLNVSSKMEDVFEAFRFSKKQTIFPIVNSQGEPKGIIKELDLKEFIYSPFGKDLLTNKSSIRKISHFIHKCPIIDVSASSEAILDLYTYHPETEGIVITQAGKYYGFLSSQALLKIMNNRRLDAAIDQNPLSKLPGNNRITQFTHQLIDQDHEQRFLCYIDFDNFKPFNDYYTFLKGDKAISLFADLMKKEFPMEDFLLGHIGGDDFFIGASNHQKSYIMSKLTDLRQAFSSQAEKLYTPLERSRGFIETEDRYGKLRQFPLLTCSIAIIELPKDESIQDYEMLLRIISDAKAAAKIEPDGIIYHEYRETLPMAETG